MKEEEFKVIKVKSIKKDSSSISKGIDFRYEKPSYFQNEDDSIGKNSNRMDSSKTEKSKKDIHSSYKSFSSYENSTGRLNRNSSSYSKDSLESKNVFSYKDSLNQEKSVPDAFPPELLNWLKSFNTQIANLYKLIHQVDSRLNQVMKDCNFNLGSTLNQFKRTEDSIRGSLQRMETKVALLNACLLEKKVEEVQVKGITKNGKNRD